MTGAEAMKALEESKLAANVAGEVARILMSGMQCPRFGPGAPTIPEVAAMPFVKRSVKLSKPVIFQISESLSAIILRKH